MSRTSNSYVDRERNAKRTASMQLDKVEEIEVACRAYRNGILNKREYWERIMSAIREINPNV